MKPVTDLAMWEKKDRSALSAIRLRVADKMLVYVASAKSSNAAWKALKEVLEPQGALGIVMARRKLFRAQCEEQAEITEHIRVMQGYREELIGLGQAITEQEFSITLLTSLPETWNNFIGGIDTTKLDSSSTIISRILEYDRRTRLQSETALAGTQKGKKSSKRITCYNCGKPGHIKSECRSPKKEKGRDGKDWKGKDSKKEKAHVAEEESVDYAWVAETINQEVALTGISHNAWLADSACTTHVARERSAFTDYQEIGPGHTIQGFGKSPALGKGTVRMISRVGSESIKISLHNVLHVPDAPYNLISIGVMTEKGNNILFMGNLIKIKAPNDKIIAVGERQRKLYTMRMEPWNGGQEGREIALAGLGRKGRMWNEWHRVLGHANMRSIKLLKEKE